MDSASIFQGFPMFSQNHWFNLEVENSKSEFQVFSLSFQLDTISDNILLLSMGS